MRQQRPLRLNSKASARFCGWATLRPALSITCECWGSRWTGTMKTLSPRFRAIGATSSCAKATRGTPGRGCGSGWAAGSRRTRHIGDFREWKNHDKYKEALGRLLRDLKAGGEDGGLKPAATAPEAKRDFSLRKPTAPQERGGKKKRRPAPFEMTGGGVGAGYFRGVCNLRGRILA